MDDPVPIDRNCNQGRQRVPVVLPIATSRFGSKVMIVCEGPNKLRMKAQTTGHSMESRNRTLKDVFRLIGDIRVPSQKSMDLSSLRKKLTFAET